MNYKSKRIMN